MKTLAGFSMTLGMLLLFFVPAASGDDYGDAVTALNPTHYYRLDEAGATAGTDAIADFLFSAKKLSNLA